MERRLLHDFAEIASDWFWETDAEHRFIFFSNRISEVLGVPGATFTGMSRSEILKGCVDEEEWHKHLADLDARRPFRNFTYQAQKPGDGSLIWVRTSGQPVFSTRGEFLGYRGTACDVTLEIETLRQLETSNTELKDRNADLLKAKQTIERMAYEDILTGLKNRRFIEDELIRMSSDESCLTSVLHVDLDRFKQINDTLGHAAGDEVLCIVANRLQSCFPPPAVIGRMGGDEFLVLVRDVNRKKLLEMVDRATREIQKTVFLCEVFVNPGASFGIAFNQDTTDGMQDLLSKADAALYEAKALGRNRAQVYSPELHQRISEQKKLARDVQLGVQNDEFEVWFQPQIDAVSGQISGAEALMRWRCPKRGVLAPAQFISTAEDLGLLSQLDGSVLRKSLAFVAWMADAGYRLPRLSINVSSNRLTDDDIVKEVLALWRDKQTQLSFELAETVTFDGEMSEIIKHNLDRLRDCGVLLEIDDFGTGHASITALLQVEPDFLKIDRSLVARILIDEKCFRLVTTVIDMAKAMNIGVIAEGVETREQAQCLAQLGCHHLQGFYLARPMSSKAFATFAGRSHNLLASTG